MTREILFRGKRTDNGEWVYGNLTKRDDVREWEYFIGQNSLGYEVIPETVGQYTGSNDKSGKKIFEGDILWECHNIKGVVRFGKYETPYRNPSNIQDIYSKHIGFYVEWQENLYRPDFGFWANENVPIIGNIHDNPELLEV